MKMTKSIIPFDVILVPFPFSNLQAAKLRPCLVLAAMKPARYPLHLVVAMMTSHLEKHFPHDLLLEGPSEAGLPKPTLIRLAKLVTIDSTLIKKKLGSLSKADRKQVEKEWRKLFVFEA
jgi:mRNA interferase MazF